MKQQGTHLIHFAGKRDPRKPTVPAAALVVNGVLAYLGDPSRMPGDLNEFAQQAEQIDQRDRLIIPAMVNAHAHLELTDIGPKPYDPAGGFVEWVKGLRAELPSDQDALIASARRGAEMCRQAGIWAVGDIASSIGVAQAVHASGLLGYSYQELFGLGPPYDQQSKARIVDLDSDVFWDAEADRQPYLRLGLEPHAPYSAGDGVFAASADPTHFCSTHLAETQEEAEFVASLSGPLFEYVQSLGRWNNAFANRYGQGLSPVQWMRPYFEASRIPGTPYSRWLVAHCNYADDDDIHLLADAGVSVVYCPIASEYFGHTGHRYRDMLTANVNVCLGTDSIICANPDDPQPLGVMGAMRRLYQRDQTDPDTLLEMATVNGCRAFRCDCLMDESWHERLVTVGVHPDSSVDPWIQALTNDSQVEPLVFNSLPDSDERIFDGSPRQHWLHRLRDHGRADGAEPA